jgi:hypothetical protein
MGDIQAEFLQGYLDGKDDACPEPGPNRSHAYRHSFEVARREMRGIHWPADVARQKAAIAAALDVN